MFGKKKCKRCGKKIDKKFDFCPYCGNRTTDLLEDKEDWGMLGKNDFISQEIMLPAGLNSIFGSLMSNLEKQFKDIDKEFGKMEKNEVKTEKKFPGIIKTGGISISISTSNNRLPIIKVNSMGNIPEFQEKTREMKRTIKEIEPKSLSEENIKKFSKLPRKEPNTNVRRLSDKVIYEMDLPGVKSIKDVSIIKLENSIEIKAVAKDKAFFKLIPINLPIANYKISDGKLVLELEAKS